MTEIYIVELQKTGRFIFKSMRKSALYLFKSIWKRVICMHYNIVKSKLFNEM